jgi:hypothetical protein
MKPGPRPKGMVSIKWSPDFAYAICLIVADGYVSKDGRHISLTSKDREQVETFKKCLGIHTKISAKYSGGGKRAYHTQFGDVLFHQYLVSIGIGPAKSKTIGAVCVPDEYFRDFFRGYFDGDGSTYSYDDSMWKTSYRFYTSSLRLPLRAVALLCAGSARYTFRPPPSFTSREMVLVGLSSVSAMDVSVLPASSPLLISSRSIAVKLSNVLCIRISYPLH